MFNQTTCQLPVIIACAINELSMPGEQEIKEDGLLIVGASPSDTKIYETQHLYK